MKTEWISVKEKLPSFGESVICYYTPRTPVMEGKIIGILKRQDTLDIPSGMLRLFDENGFALAAKVTHWMPLPQPPTN